MAFLRANWVVTEKSVWILYQLKKYVVRPKKSHNLSSKGNSLFCQTIQDLGYQSVQDP